MEAGGNIGERRRDGGEDDDVGVVVSPSSPQPALKSRAADALDVHGGFVLLLGGVALIVLACVFASTPAVAPIFAVSGASLLVLSAFYSRIEGNVQATKDGVKAAVRAAQRKSEEVDLPASLLPEALDRTIDRLQISSRRHQDIELAGEQAATEAVEAVARDPRAIQAHIIDRFTDWLASKEGGEFRVIRKNVLTPQGEFDVIADGLDEIVIVEAKASRRPNGWIIRELAQRTPPADLRPRSVRRALVLPADATLTRSAKSVAQATGVEVYRVRDDGEVFRMPLAD
jgi:hypothetical protein